MPKPRKNNVDKTYAQTIRKGEQYWFIVKPGVYQKSIYQGTLDDIERAMYGNMYRTIEEAKSWYGS